MAPRPASPVRAAPPTAHRAPAPRSASAAAWMAVAVLAFAALAFVTLTEGVALLMLGALLLFVLFSLFAVLTRNRRVIATLAAVGLAVTVGAGLAFFRTLDLVWGTDGVAQLAAADADSYFYLAVAAAGITLLLLFVGAVWPARRHR